jgi:hypothetical protein
MFHVKQEEEKQRGEKNITFYAINVFVFYVKQGGVNMLKVNTKSNKVIM